MANSFPSSPTHELSDQRLQFHLQLMGRLPSHIDSTNLDSDLLPITPIHYTLRQSSIHQLNSLTTDPSPYHHAMLSQQSSHSTRPSSRASTLSSSMPIVPPLYYPHSPLSSRHSSSTQLSPYPSPFLIPPRPSSAQSNLPFDPDYHAERLRLAKLEQRRSMAMGPTTLPFNPSRSSSVGSIGSVRSFRSVRPSRSKAQSPSGGVSSALPSVYRPSPLRSTSTPDLGVIEAEPDKRKHRKEMKEEYEKMRAARIEEEKLLLQQQQQRCKSTSQDSHQSWFMAHFKRTKEAPSMNSSKLSENNNTKERRSNSQSSGSDSLAQSSSTPDHEAHSVTTVPTSEEGSCQRTSQSRKSEELIENNSDQMSSFESPVVDPFRKSMLPGQVPPTPTKISLASPAPPKSLRNLTSKRINLHKLNKLFDTLKLGGGSSHGISHSDHHHMDHNKKKPNSTDITPPPPLVDQSSWIESIKSIRSKSTTSHRRRTLVGIFLHEKDNSSPPPPVPKLPEQIIS